MNGKTINGFTLQRLLGVGGMAEVWLAENKIGKKAAVKLLLPKLCLDVNVTSRFYTEAKVMVDLNHPNIRQVYDCGEIDGRPAIVMEYLDGEDLKTKLKHGQRFTDEELKKWWNQLVLALNYTHQKDIVHRDIKPGNIFVDCEGNIKLLDFGIAKVRESISSTQTGQKLGTLMYMSPEQVKDSKHIDYHTDIYSLAVTFVHLLTGKRPYDSDTSSDFEISEQIVYKPLDLSGISSDWRNFLAPYLEKDPEKRPALRPFEVEVRNPPEDMDDDATFVDASISSSKGATSQTPPFKEDKEIEKDSIFSIDNGKPTSKRKVPNGHAVFVAFSILVYAIGCFAIKGVIFTWLVVALASFIAGIGLFFYKPPKFKALPWVVMLVTISLAIWFIKVGIFDVIMETGDIEAVRVGLVPLIAAIPIIAITVVLLQKRK